jgi:hypothetical protein
LSWFPVFNLEIESLRVTTFLACRSQLSDTTCSNYFPVNRTFFNTSKKPQSNSNKPHPRKYMTMAEADPPSPSEHRRHFRPAPRGHNSPVSPGGEQSTPTAENKTSLYIYPLLSHPWPLQKRPTKNCEGYPPPHENQGSGRLPELGTPLRTYFIHS